MKIILPGPYPRSERQIQATRHFDRSRVSEDDLVKVRFEDARVLKELQQGFPYLSTAMFHWQDLMRPLVGIISEARVSHLKRFFETNSFWRVLEFQLSSRLNPEDLQSWIDTYLLADGLYTVQEPIIINLPFLFTFREYSTGLHLDAIASLLEKICHAVSKLPKGVLCFHEPALGCRAISEEDKRVATRFVEKLKGDLSIPVFIQTFYSPLEVADRSFLYDLAVDGIGIDFYANTLEDIMKHFPDSKVLLAGVISTHTTRVENPEKIGNFVEKMKKFLPEEKIYLSVNGVAELIPREVMDDKVRNLRMVI